MLKVSTVFTYLVYTLYSCYKWQITNDAILYELSMVSINWALYYTLNVMMTIYCASIMTREVKVYFQISVEHFCLCKTMYCFIFFKGKEVSVIIHKAINRIESEYVTTRV